MELPTEEQIKEQLYDILTQVAKVKHIEQFEINANTEYNYGDGLVGMFYDGKVINKQTGETISVVIKKAPPLETPFINYNAIFKNEDLFYQNWYSVIDKLQKDAGVSEPFDNLPKYLCGNLEPKKEYIAMENLKPQGYIMFDKMEFLGEEHLEMLFKVYAKFHALSYVLRKKELDKFESIRKDYSDLLSAMTPMIEKPMLLAVSVAVSSLDPEKDKLVYDEIKDLRENSLKIFMKSFTYNGEHKCFLHGDCWSNNLLFKYSETGKLLDVKLIDFQQCRAGTPILDLSYLFYSGASKREFDKLDHYLQIYHKTFFEFAKELGANTEEIFTFEELKNEWQEYGISGVLMGIYLWQIKLVPKEAFVEMAKSMSDVQANGTVSMEEMQKQWESLQSIVHGNEKYRENTSAILRHAFEYGVINREKIVRKVQ